MSKIEFPEGQGPELKVTGLCAPSVHTAQKFDSGKPRLSKVPVEIINGIAEVLAFGAIKYDWDNWKKGMDHSRILDATLRHVYKYANGENKDDESGLNHLKHAATNLAFLLHYVEKGLGNDDRAPN